MDLNWYHFADKDDVRARKLYDKLDLARSTWDWADGWLKVPKKLHLDFEGGFEKPYHEFWNGMDWVRVVVYKSADGKMYARLPMPGEFPE